MTDRSVKVTLRGDISDFNRSMLAAAAGTKAFTQSLDTSTDRMQNLVQTSLALGPALIPVGAAAVPAISGLTSQLAFAAAGAGVAAVAFQGVGDALGALNDFGLDPTSENLTKVSEAMRTLSPAGRDFALFLRDIGPAMGGLQDVAQAGLFPGLEVGLRSMSSLLPQVEGIISEVSSALGELAAEGGANLASPQWSEFFDFLESEAKPTLVDLGRSVGNLTEGLANLWMAFDPLSDQFSQGFLQMSRDFAEWTSTLDETEGFQEFLDYIDRVGPKVWDTLGALGNALLQIVEAAAPVGELSLPVIEAIADTLALIADSPAGPVLIGAAAGIAALSRSVALFNVANGAALTAMMNRLGGKGAVFRAAGAGAGIMALQLTDLDDKMGIANTTALALAGSIAGPWGAAIGGAAGLAMDLASANDDVFQSLERIGESLTASGPNDLEAQLEAVNRAYAMADALDQRGGLGSLKDLFVGGFGGETAQEKALALADQTYATYLENKAAAQDLAFAQAGLGNAMDDASDSAREQLAALLENQAVKNRLADDTLSAAEAERRLEEAFDNATAAVARNGRTLDIETPKGRENARAIDDVAASWNNLTEAQMYEPGALEKWRDRYVELRVAAGEGREEAEAFAETVIKLPPEIRTQFIAAGAAEAIAVAVEVAENLKKTPEEVETELRALNYTDEQIDEVLRRLADLRDTKTEPKITANGDQAKTVIGQVRQMLSGLKDKTVNVKVQQSYTVSGQRVTGGYGGGITKNADGGFITGPGGPRDDAIPAWLSNGEFVVNAAATRANIGLLHAINNSRRYADGGYVEAPTYMSMAPASYLAPPELAGLSGLSIDYDQLAAATARALEGTSMQLQVDGRRLLLATREGYRG